MRVRAQKGARIDKLNRAILWPIGLDHRNRWLLTVNRDPKCLTHPEQRLVIFCPACRGAAGGQSVSRKKIKAVKKNLKRATRARKRG